MFLFYGSLEHAARQDPTDPPGKLCRTEAGFGKSYLGALNVHKGDDIADPEKMKRSLNAELAYGRLPMMAIIGMFFHFHWVLGSTMPGRGSAPPAVLVGRY
ncbi:unnamed protein product [Prorocentrum cordatum]|uniref:Uncharacterized protein n=1 Tax=Prorocentrum cordatum TaxID=2364126 RepID=A0ABN9T0W6_9DINO|nr:unnamed protein product [Polarella glacialis]